MGWVSYLEDIQKHAEDLERLIERIHLGEIPYVDENRAKVVDITKQIRVMVGRLEKTLRNLGPDDQAIIDENVSSKQLIAKLNVENQRLESDLKQAYEQANKFKEQFEDEWKKHRFTINKYIESPSEFSRYVLKLCNTYR